MFVSATINKRSSGKDDGNGVFPVSSVEFSAVLLI